MKTLTLFFICISFFVYAKVKHRDITQKNLYEYSSYCQVNDSTGEDRVEPIQIKKYRILLNAHGTYDIASFIPSDIKIDSISFFKDYFFAKVTSECGFKAGSPYPNIEKILINLDSNEYHSLKNVTTAYTFYDSAGNEFHFDSKKSYKCKLPCGKKLIVFSTIYLLFNKGKLITPFLVVDSIKEY